LIPLARRVGQWLAGKGRTLAVAESCTGGLIGHALTEVPGISRVFRGGVVAYGDSVKRRLLGVPRGLLARHGAVSREVARAMARGVRRRTGADWGLAVTGVAGPGGGTAKKPIGLVFVASAGPRGLLVRECRFTGGRSRIKRQAAREALQLLLELRGMR
jgi:PncC family amidohydrolase